MSSIKPFLKGYLDEVLRNCISQIKSRVDGEQEKYLLNVNEEEYIDHLVSEFIINPPQVDLDNMSVTSTEKMIEARRHPGDFFFDEDGAYKRQVVIYHLPFSGDLEILNFKPNPSLLWTVDLEHVNEGGESFLTFEIVNFTNDPEYIKREADGITKNLSTQLDHIKNQIDGYNSSLRGQITEIVQARKKDLLSKGDILSALGVPIQKKENVAETFSVPAPQVPKKIIPKPAATSPGKPEPTLDTETYEAILKIVHDVGKSIERMPSTYEGKDEEALRDHLLMFLEPQFEGSATGETFNKAGKTDILLRYESNNVFIAECKFWSGEVKFLETIDQILKYLTWRDSKAAIVLFVKNADFTNVISTVKESVSKHPNYIKFIDEKDETWLQYKIHLNGDKGREIFLTVLLFHFPPLETND